MHASLVTPAPNELAHQKSQAFISPPANRYRNRSPENPAAHLRSNEAIQRIYSDF
jgi:hypothetical protein